MSKSEPPMAPPAPEVYETVANVTDPTFKYYQVAVPGHSFNQTGDQTGVTRTVPNAATDQPAGNTFLRLGAFPDVTNPSMGPAGFQASLDLAKIAGDATGIQSLETPDAAPSTYGGDPGYLLGFADDTRVRSGGLSTAQRKAESAVLLTKGGWWDHSDGNRISTTVGDKIEIIQGNYKMVVIGRQDPATAASTSLIRDVSGGMLEENGPSPTHCIKTIEWTQEADGATWSVYQNNGLGNVYSSFYGITGDLFVGPLKETWTGQAPPGFPQSDFYVNSQAQRSVEGAVTSGLETDIKDYTWAKSITSYTGSVQKPIPLVTEETWITTITSLTNIESTTSTSTIGTSTETSTIGTSTETTTVGTSTSTTNVGTVTETTTIGTSTSTTTAGSIIETTAVGSTISTTAAGSIIDTTAADSIVETKVASSIVGMTAAASIVDLKAAAHILEVAVALKTSITVSLMRQVYIGGRFELDVSVSTAIRLGPRFEYVSSEADTVIGDQQTEVTVNKTLLAAQILLGI